MRLEFGCFSKSFNLLIIVDNDGLWDFDTLMSAKGPLRGMGQPNPPILGGPLDENGPPSMPIYHFHWTISVASRHSQSLAKWAIAKLGPTIHFVGYNWVGLGLGALNHSCKYFVLFHFPCLKIFRCFGANFCFSCKSTKKKLIYFSFDSMKNQFL